jgi:hypothetical protein
LSYPSTAIANWTLKDCGKHGDRQYTLFINGNAYHGGNEWEEVRCEAIKLGDSIDFIYKRKNPTNNFGGKREAIPHESPHFEATRKSLIFGFPRRLDGESADWGSDASTEGAI